MQVSGLVSAHESSDKLYLCKDPNYILRPSTKTRKKKFCIDIPIGNPSVEFKTLLDRSDPFYE